MSFDERFRLLLTLGGGAGLAGLGLRGGALWAIVAGAAIAVIGGGLALRPWWRRRSAIVRPFPEDWRGVLEEHVRFYRRLDEEGKARFETSLQVLIAEHSFHGVDGAEVDDEVRVLAMAGAAILVHGMGDLRIKAMRDIVIYPDHFDEDYDLAAHAPIAGMVHRQGPVLFSAKALRRGWKDSTDGYNVSLHEFAHVLDLADGFADGIPSFGVDPDSWDPLVAEALDRVRRHRSKLRDYAGTNRAELFAVAVETFFEKPRALRKAHTELYDELVRFFGLDPGERDPDPPKTRKKRRKKRRKRR